MITFMISLVATSAYVTFVYILSTYCKEIVRSRCNGCVDNRNCLSCEAARIGAFAAATIWPVTLPAILIWAKTQKNSPEVRRLREIAQAEHDAKLAAIRVKEAAALDREYRIALGLDPQPEDGWAKVRDKAELKAELKALLRGRR